jgi:hypothetical protein
VRVFLAHLAREARDQRQVLLGVALSLPGLTVLAFWGFAERLVAAPVRDVAGVVVPVALLLLVLAVGGDLFAGEMRRGTIACLRRTPGGLRAAFAAKVALLSLALAAVAGEQSLLLSGGWALSGRSPAFGSADPLAVLGAAAGSPWAWAVLVLAAWVLLASTWLAQGGMAVLVAPLLLGALAVPAYVWFKANPLLGAWLVGGLPDRFAAWLLGGAAAGALAAADVSFVRGRAVARGAWAAVWRGLAVVGVVAGATYAWAGWRVARALDLEPGLEDVRLCRALLARGGATLWVEACRELESFGRPAPFRSFRVDVATGAFTEVGGWQEPVEVPPVRGVRTMPGTPASSLEPQPILVQYRQGEDDEHPVATWLDAASGAVLRSLPAGVRPPEVAVWIAEAGRLATPVRDAQGRRAWIRPDDGALCREGEDLPPRGPAAAFQWFQPVPGGWTGWDSRGKALATLDAASGEARLVEVGLPLIWVLSPERRLLLDPKVARGSGGRWRVLDDATGEGRPAVGIPSDAVGVVAVLERDAVLLLAGEAEAGAQVPTLVLWDPLGGSSRDLDWSPAPPPAPLRDYWVQGRSSDGRTVLSFRAGDRHETVCLDPATGVAVRLDASDEASVVFALSPDGAAWAIEAQRRIVRLGPDPFARAVVFPR